MKLKIALVVVGLAGILGAFVTTALATPADGVTAVTARGALQRMTLKTKFDNGAQVKITTHGSIEFITQRVEIAPGGTTGWHFHPGETLVVVQQGTLALYHDEHCMVAVPYGPDTAFVQHPDDVHLARNNSATDTLVIFATYFHPKTTPPTPIRIDAPSPGAGCPE